MITRLKWLGLVLMAGIGLGGCGSDREALVGLQVATSAAKQAITQRGQPAPAVTREMLNAYATPMIMAEIPALKITTFVVPFAQNGDVETWATVDDKTISFRQGIMVATRGFGADIMQATGPSAAQLASGSGSHDRAYYYLDGADQTQRFDYHCTVAVAGIETITVVSEQHQTHHIIENCAGKPGVFANEYWFEGGTFLRQSKQLLVQPLGSITFRRVIDKG
ncbi:MAG: YjbF family lipoprotein [Pseudorhodobacter sp.]|nr:YjbF family lipoprotein [Pseudorhodobacter sp.]